MSGPLLQDVQELPFHYAPIGYAAPLDCGVLGFLRREACPSGQPDPLLPAVTRFVAARPFTGPWALMRRFNIGLQRARGLLTELAERRLVRGHWCRQAAVAFLNDSEAWAFRRYRVQPGTWAALQGCV